MQQSEQQLLTDIYNHYLATQDREISFSFVNSTHAKKINTINSLNYLEECGYIHCVARAMGFCQFKLTVNGIKFVENGFKESTTTPVIQGDNSIFVNGSSNTVSGNYNKISLDITNSDLPDDYKRMIESFLYEIKNPHLPPEKKSEKIKSFISDISSGTISGVASSGLTILLSSLLSQIPL